MRMLPLLVVLPLLALQAHAQTSTPLAATPLPNTAASGGTDSTAGAAATPRHHRMTWKERFAQANVAHDGHLTLQEASGGYLTIARHFKEIDADKKGYVTEEDITNWHKLQRAMRHANPSRSSDALRPRPAIQRGTTAPQPISTSTDSTVLPMSQPAAK